MEHRFLEVYQFVCECDAVQDVVKEDSLRPVRTHWIWLDWYTWRMQQEVWVLIC